MHALGIPVTPTYEEVQWQWARGAAIEATTGHPDVPDAPPCMQRHSSMHVCTSRANVVKVPHVRGHIAQANGMEDVCFAPHTNNVLQWCSCPASLPRQQVAMQACGLPFACSPLNCMHV